MFTFLCRKGEGLSLTVVTRASDGVKKMPPPRPVITPWVSMSCQ